MTPRTDHASTITKLLLDPYARNVVGTVKWCDALFGYRIGNPREDLVIDRRDSAPAMPKCRVIDGAFSWTDDRPPRTPWHDTIIYELHVQGFTQHNQQIAPHLRGTYAGLATDPAIEHLKRLGSQIATEAILELLYGALRPPTRYAESGTLRESLRCELAERIGAVERSQRSCPDL